MSRAYYNEYDPKAAAWLRQLITMGLIADGDVDDRSIADVSPDDVRGYTQVHFFAGIGGWSYAARLAGWPDSRPLWTGSCPCQPFSVAGKGAGTDDPRHLWPHLLRLTSAIRPAVLMGEQVAGAAGYVWFDGVGADLAGEGYASRAVDIPACAVDSPHIRQRLYWIAVADAKCAQWRSEYVLHRSPDPEEGQGRQQGPATSGERHDTSTREMADASGRGREQGIATSQTVGHGGQPATADGPTGTRTDHDLGHTLGEGLEGQRWDGDNRPRWQDPDGSASAPNGSFWSEHEWIACHDGKARRTEPSIPLLAHGVSHRVVKWSGFGNAIVPQVAAKVIRAFMETEEML